MGKFVTEIWAKRIAEEGADLEHQILAKNICYLGYFYQRTQPGLILDAR